MNRRPPHPHSRPAPLPHGAVHDASPQDRAHGLRWSVPALRQGRPLQGALLWRIASSLRLAALFGAALMGLAAWATVCLVLTLTSGPAAAQAPSPLGDPTRPPGGAAPGRPPALPTSPLRSTPSARPAQRAAAEAAPATLPLPRLQALWRPRDESATATVTPAPQRPATPAALTPSALIDGHVLRVGAALPGPALAGWTLQAIEADGVWLQRPAEAAGSAALASASGGVGAKPIRPAPSAAALASPAGPPARLWLGLLPATSAAASPPRP